MKTLSTTFVLLIALSMTDGAWAQGFGFSVSTQNGVPVGGSLQINGAVVTGGGRYVRMGVNTGTSQLIGVNQFTFQNGNNGFGGGNMGGGGFGGGNIQASSPPPPTVDGFLLAAMKFDKDENELLDEKELGAVGLAIWKELEQRNSQVTRQVRTSNSKKNAKSEEELLKEVRLAFVKKSMKFDKDFDDSLSEKETRTLGAALIRSLLKKS